MHLAQLNVAHMRAPIDSPELADFVAALSPSTRLADAAPGFVWRLKEGDEPRGPRSSTTTATTCWSTSRCGSRATRCGTSSTAAATWAYCSGAGSGSCAMAEPYTVMWWIPEGPIRRWPRAMERLERLKARRPHAGGLHLQGLYEQQRGRVAPAAAEARK